MTEATLQYLPLFLSLREQRTVVIGGGLMATRKAELLLRAGARVTVVAPEIHAELRELLTRHARKYLSHVNARFDAAQLEGATIVIAATNCGETNSAVARAARERNIPVNVVDNPALSSFIVPAIIDRDPVVVAVSTGGSSPVLARRIRAQIETLLPGKLGALARFAAAQRSKVRAALRPTQRRAFWERVLGGPVATHVLAGREALATAAFERALRNTVSGKGEVYLIGAGPGDPDLLTLRAVQLLQQADVVLYDRLVSPAVLDRARRDAERVFVGKQPGDHAMSQERINQLLVQYARRGLRVARLKGGDPFIFGRGGEEAAALRAAGVAVTAVPGITAALGAAAYGGIALTQREVSQSVTFVTGHVATHDTLDWRSLARPHQTVVFYMGVAEIERIVAQLTAHGALGSHPVAIVERATLPEQRVLRGTLADIAEIVRASAVTAPALLIVGEVTDLAAVHSHIQQEHCLVA